MNFKPILVLVESIAKRKKIEDFLGDGYKVIAMFGPNTALKNVTGSISDNMVEPRKTLINDLNMVATSTKIMHYSEIRRGIMNSSKVIIATDDDGDGEALGYHVCHVFKLPIDTTPRIIFNQITEIDLNSV